MLKSSNMTTVLSPHNTMTTDTTRGLKASSVRGTFLVAYGQHVPKFLANDELHDIAAQSFHNYYNSPNFQGNLDVLTPVGFIVLSTRQIEITG